jgi:pilus assembly protein CpaB
MRGAQVGILVLGLGLAGYGVFTAQSYIAETNEAIARAQAQQTASGSAIELVQLAVASRPLRYGEPILDSDVVLVDWPAHFVPSGVFHSLDELVSDPRRPRVALRAMEANEPILAIKVSQPGQPAGIAAQLTPGMRAFTIRIDAGSGISGTLRPSDMVDLYWTGRGTQGEVTRLLSSALRIIALDENADQDRSSTGVPRSVTIEAAPETVATIAQGQSTGRLSLSVVGLDDDRVLEAIEIDSSRLLGVQTQAEVVEERCTIRTRRGAEVVTIEIPCTN